MGGCPSLFFGSSAARQPPPRQPPTMRMQAAPTPHPPPAQPPRLPTSTAFQHCARSAVCMVLTQVTPVLYQAGPDAASQRWAQPEEDCGQRQSFRVKNVVRVKLFWCCRVAGAAEPAWLERRRVKRQPNGVARARERQQEVSSSFSCVSSTSGCPGTAHPTT
jgi:hypothetical protein